MHTPPRPVQLTWTTASERDNHGFVVERSPDGRTFAAISDLIVGQGTSATPTHYAWADETAPAERVYYRLRQLDTDGTATYSSIVAVRPKQRETSPVPLEMYPNPAHDLLSVRPPTGATQVQILDATGRVVLTLPATAGEVVRFALPLPRGVYAVKAGPETARLVIE